MIEADRVLRPLREAEPAIDQLETYESPAALTEALRATWHAVERTLRTLLRSDATAPDSIRMTALSAQQMPTETVLSELRRRDLISIPMAGRVHELRQVVERAEQGSVRAADADGARDVVRALVDEVRHAATRAAEAAAHARPDADTAAEAGAGIDSRREVPTGVNTCARATVSAGDRPARVTSFGRPASRTADEPHTPVPSGSEQRARRRPLYVIAVVGTLLVAAAILVFLFGRDSDLDRGIAAFAGGRAGVAEQHFRAALADDADNVTARLYLARILRTQGRTQEAADLLRAAARLAPRDAAVRRELGHLFMDLRRPPAAIEQFRIAVELEPAESLNWVALVEALARAGDPSADEWLRRAPAEARAIIETGRRRPSP
jgi:tetratricopeptide (TPR) repeat protein